MSTFRTVSVWPTTLAVHLIYAAKQHDLEQQLRLEFHRTLGYVEQHTLLPDVSLSAVHF
jgi:hypothetical protein